MPFTWVNSFYFRQKNNKFANSAFKNKTLLTAVQLEQSFKLSFHLQLHAKIAFLGILCLTQIAPIFGQFTKITPLVEQPEIERTHFKTVVINPISWLITDTLSLPFFEDFAEVTGFPSLTRWTDKQVWVNNSFTPDAPNAFVATFDHLNEKGKAYSNTLNKNVSVFADSLTSQPINLQFYKNGPNTFPYKLTDNIYLSFFYKTQGLGDIPELEDSLVLFFKGKDKQWHRVWSVGGKSMSRFEEIYVPIDNDQYLIPDFQFRWVNFTKATGNLNHWHVDYIRMEKGRFGGFNDIEDVGIVNAYTGLINDYSNLPYTHYRNNQSLIRGKGAGVTVKNLSETATVQTRYSLSILNTYGQKLYEQGFSVSSRNILAMADSLESFNTPFFDTLSGKTPSLKYQFIIDPRSNDNTADNYNTKTLNNRYELTHQFMPWYSYDDGSAEGGFGLDYAYLGNIKGQFAMEFNTLEDDSLRGLAMYFTQTKDDVSFRSFKLRIWRAISPIGASDNKDELIYEFPMERPIYRDSINHFNYIFFDSVLFLKKGKYYVGWVQTLPYVLNVGYDNNYRYNGQDQYNPRLFYNLLGSWERADFNIKGTPMIRMLFGERINYSFSTPKVEKLGVSVFPNPANYILHVHLTNPNTQVSHIVILDAVGRFVKRLNYTTALDVSSLNPGTYFIKVVGLNGQSNTLKFHKE